MRKVKIGDFVETKYGVNGILVDVKQTPYGLKGFIATSDDRIFHCPVSDFKDCYYSSIII